MTGKRLPYLARCAPRPSYQSGEQAQGENMTTSRRQFLKAAAATTTGALVAHSLPALGRSGAEVAVTPSLSLFGYSQVQLLDGPFRRQFDQNHDLFLHLDEDA